MDPRFTIRDSSVTTTAFGQFFELQIVHYHQRPALSPSLAVLALLIEQSMRGHTSLFGLWGVGQRDAALNYPTSGIGEDCVPVIGPTRPAPDNVVVPAKPR